MRCVPEKILAGPRCRFRNFFLKARQSRLYITAIRMKMKSDSAIAKQARTARVESQSALICCTYTEFELSLFEMLVVVFPIPPNRRDWLARTSFSLLVALDASYRLVS